MTKYVVLLCDGMADYPVEELGNKTPMGASHTPNMDKLAKKSTIGLVKSVADGLKPGSDVANLSILGYDPAIYYSGRSPLEAGSIGIDMKPTDVSFRCNLVTLSDEENYEDKTIIDYCADDISTEEAKIHPLAQKSKDAAAAAVLCISFFAAVIGVVFFWDLKVFGEIFSFFSKNIIALIGLIFSAIIWFVIIFVVKTDKNVKKDEET